IEMHFLPDVYVECEVCHGRRYNRETLEITYKGKNIADVLDLTVDEAARFFRNVPSVSDKLNAMLDVGLGYLRLGQAATTLSGGEAQRVKLATELAKKATGRTFYILDEPTSGQIKTEIAEAARPVDEGVPEVAVYQLQKLVARLSGTDAVKAKEKLAEALIAARRLSEALRLLEDPALRDSTSGKFLRAQA